MPAIGAALLALAGPPAFAKGDSVPDWVRDAAAQKLPSYPAETNAVVLLEETTYTVKQDGQALNVSRPSRSNQATSRYFN